MAWELRRTIDTRSNLWDRTADPVGGQAVVYAYQGPRLFVGYVNGGRFELSYPDTSAAMEGDAGQPVAVRLRYDYAEQAWYLYAYIFSGDNNPRSEWLERIA